jgi:hypothetical protein
MDNIRKILSRRQERQFSGIQVMPDPLLADLDVRWRKEEERGRLPGKWAARTIAQLAGLQSSAFLLLLGGAAGSLKTSTLLINAAKYRDNKKMRSYFFRRTYKELEGGGSAIDQSRQFFPGTGATYNDSKHAWTWPSGAELYFRHCQHEKDVYTYQSHGMTSLSVDESTHWPEKMLRYLITRVRSADPSIDPEARLGTNPGGIGHAYHKKLFFGDVCPHCHPKMAPPQAALRFDARWPSDNKPLSQDGIDRSVSYILSYVTDHDLLGEEYVANLKMQSAATAKALLEGCWDIFEGQFFDCLRPSMIISRRELKEQWWWPRWVASDYGFSISLAVAMMFLHEPASPQYPRGRVIIADEFGCQETAKRLGRLILDRWVLDRCERAIEHRWMPWYLSPDSWAEKGTEDQKARPDSIAAQLNETLRPYGHHFNRANNDRTGGALKLYSGFEEGELVLCSECTETVKAFQDRIHDPDRPNDVLKVQGDPLDDYYDTARYGYMSFETHRGVQAPTEACIAEQLGRMWKEDPTAAMIMTQQVIERERRKGQPTYYGGSMRRRLLEWQRNRGPFS